MTDFLSTPATRADALRAMHAETDAARAQQAAIEAGRTTTTPPARVRAALLRMGIDPTNADDVLSVVTAPWDDDTRPAGIGWITLDAVWSWARRDAGVIAHAASQGIDATDEAAMPRPSDA